MTALVDHLPDIGVTVISSWIFNCYVVHDGGAGQPFVVDVGTSGHAPLVDQVLRDHGSHLDDLACAVATHGHGDHVGGLPALRRTSTRVPIALPGRIEGYLDGERPRAPTAKDVLHILPVMADQPFSLAPLLDLRKTITEIGFDGRGKCEFPFRPDVWLRDGDPVPGAPDWVVIQTPGHTDDSLSFFCARTQTLLSGDAVLTTGGRGWFNPELCDEDLSTGTESRLRALDVSSLLPGHGRPVTVDDVWADALSWNERPVNGGALTSLRRLFLGHRHG